MSVFSQLDTLGNPAAVCFLNSNEFSDSIFLQKIAKKINISEVTFIHEVEDDFFLRWFSPLKEVDICGHGTIAAFELLTSKGFCSNDEWVVLKSKKYILKLRRFSQKSTIILQLPVFNLLEIEMSTLSEIIDFSFVRSFSSTKLDYIVEIDSLDKLRRVSIDFNLLANMQRRGLIACFADFNSNKIYYRYFCPKLGFNEDFGTGSAFSTIYPFLSKRLDFSNKISFSQESLRKSEGFVTKIENEDYIAIETNVSPYTMKTIEID